MEREELKNKNARLLEACDHNELDVVKDLLTQLLEFDFRNGPLRRKYDSVKYINRQMEDIVYELSLIGHQLTKNDQKSDGLSRVDDTTLNAISNRMKERDARREQVIKQSTSSCSSFKGSSFMCRYDMSLIMCRTQVRAYLVHLN